MVSSAGRRQSQGNCTCDCALLVQILGPPRLFLQGQPLEVVRRKARALVYYLAAHRGPVARDQVLALLWPDQDCSAARHALSTTLCELHKTFGEFLVIEKETLALSPKVEVDVRLFEERLSTPVDDLELLEDALKYYRGDFLEGFTVPGSPEYCNWQAAERERYRRLAMRGLANLAQLHEKLGNLREALEALNRALDLDPLQEDLQCACMRLQCLVGNRPGAIRRYHKLRKLLDEEMGVPPMPQTQALYDAIITGAHVDADDHSSGGYSLFRRKRPAQGSRFREFILPFVGRRSELQALHELAGERDAGLVLIEGEPGIGKTRLIEEFLREKDALVIRGAGRELEEVLPYHPVTEALCELLSHSEWPALYALIQSRLAPVWRAEIHRLVPETALLSSKNHDASTAADERRLWEAINQFLLTLASQQAVIVFLDDLHWADASTLRMLGYLVRRAAGEPIAFVAATRPHCPQSQLAALVRQLTREDLLVRIALSPLQADDIALLAVHLSPAHADVLAQWLARASEGNPYILTELVRHMRESGLLDETGAVDLGALSATPPVPRAVENFIKGRLESVSEAARRVLDTAAVVGREFESEVVARAVPLSEGIVLDGLDELVSAGLIHSPDGFRYSFDHSLTREVAYRELSKTRREWLHRRIAETLENMHSGHLEAIAGRLAWHFGQSDTPDRAGPYALLAGVQAARLGAWTEAIAFYEQAVAVSDDKVRLSALPALAEAFFAVAKLPRASEVYRQAATLARSHGDSARSEFLLGAAAISELPQVAELLWGTVPLIASEEPKVTEAIGHFKAAEALYADAEAAKLKVLAEIKIGLGFLAALQGDLPQAAACYQAMLRVASGSEEQDTVLDQIVLGHLNLASSLYLLSCPEALEHALSGLRLAQERGLLGFQPFLLSVLGEIALGVNDLDAAHRYLADGLALAERLSIPYAVAGLSARLGRLAARRGHEEEAVRQLSQALSRAEKLGAPQLAAWIRLWLIPLLPPAEAQGYLAEVRASAKNLVGGYILSQLRCPEVTIDRPFNGASKNILPQYGPGFYAG